MPAFSEDVIFLVLKEVAASESSGKLLEVVSINSTFYNVFSYSRRLFMELSLKRSLGAHYDNAIALARAESKDDGETLDCPISDTEMLASTTQIRPSEIGSHDAHMNEAEKPQDFALTTPRPPPSVSLLSSASYLHGRITTLSSYLSVSIDRLLELRTHSFSYDYNVTERTEADQMLAATYDYAINGVSPQPESRGYAFYIYMVAAWPVRLALQREGAKKMVEGWNREIRLRDDVLTAESFVNFVAHRAGRWSLHGELFGAWEEAALEKVRAPMKPLAFFEHLFEGRKDEMDKQIYGWLEEHKGEVFQEFKA